MQFKWIATLLLASIAMAASPMKSVIITFPKSAPDSAISDAKQAIIDAGGKITHEYNLIRGFAAEAPEETLATVSALDTENPPNIEEDQVYTIQ